LGMSLIDWPPPKGLWPWDRGQESMG
jgi:hypothetical protein